MAYQLLALGVGVGVGSSRLASTSRARAEPVALDGPGPLLGVQCGRGVEPVALGIDLEPEHRRPVRAAQIELAFGDQATDLREFRVVQPEQRPDRVGSSGFARKSFVGIDSSSAAAPGVEVTSTADCVARINAAFFLRHVFAASAR